VNDAGAATYVKYKMVSQQGIKNFNQAEAQRICGIDPDFSKRELFAHIAAGKTAEWVMYVQVRKRTQGEGREEEGKQSRVWLSLSLMLTGTPSSLPSLFGLCPLR
jgi:catalase